MSTPRNPVSVLAELTLNEKIALTHGRFLSGGVPRLGIAQLELADGPMGIRLMGIRPVEPTAGDDEVEYADADPDAPPRVTALPATLLLAASWNRESAREHAAVIAREMLALGKHVLLAPGVNLMRDPRGGRNFEYLGEDPFLTAEMAIAYARGLQGVGVGANLKHYVANECDRDRHYTSSNVDERTLRELYVYPFERAIREADAWSVMTGNNLVGGVHVSESEALIRGLLREEIGFDGVVLTDWRAAYEPVPSVAAGLDMTTGMCEYVYGDGELEDLVESGEIDESEIDAMARRILRLYERVGLLETGARTGAPEHDARAAARGVPAGSGEIDTARHRAAARAIAAEGMVLLRNEGNLLPLGDRPIVVTGPGAVRAEVGTGSGLVNGGAGNVGILRGLREALGEARVHHVPEVSGGGPIDLTDATTVYCAVGPRGGEGNDQDTIELPGSQAAEIRSIAAAANRLVVVLQAGSAVDLTEWHEAADAILVAWYGGQATGHAVADLLTGAVNPSGRLPCTFGNRIDDYPAAALGSWPARLLLDEHPGKPGFTKEERRRVCAYAADYSEGPFIGYRWFAARGVEPLYPFGFGLSYTSFTCDDPRVRSVEAGWEVSCRVENTGGREGSAVVQCYRVADASASGGDGATATADLPLELRGFAKVALAPGESARAAVTVRPNDLARYDVGRRAWRVTPGEHSLRIGFSSADLPLAASVVVAEPMELDAP